MTEFHRDWRLNPRKRHSPSDNFQTGFGGAPLIRTVSTWLSVGVCLDLLRLAVAPERSAVWTMARRVLSIVMVAAAIAALLSQSMSFLAAPKEVPRSVVVPAAAIAPMLWESQCVERGTQMFSIETSDLCNLSMGHGCAPRTIMNYLEPAWTIMNHHGATWHHETSWHHEASWKHHENIMTHHGIMKHHDPHWRLRISGAANAEVPFDITYEDPASGTSADLGYLLFFFAVSVVAIAKDVFSKSDSKSLKDATWLEGHCRGEMVRSEDMYIISHTHIHII